MESLSKIDRPEAVDLEALASRELNDRFFHSEALFRRLPLEEKVRLVMAYSPRIFQVETTTRCNLNCPLCSTHHLRRGRAETPLEWVERLCGENPRMRYMCLHLMGEPLLSRSLFEIVGCLASRGVYSFFSTNGLLLEKKVDAILSSGLDKLSVSLDGITQDDLGKYRVNADLETILRGVRALVAKRSALNASRPLIQVQTIMFAHNEPKEAEIIRFFRSLGVDRIKLKTPSFEAFGGKNGQAGGLEDPSSAGVRRYSREREGYVKYRDRAVCRLLFQGFLLSDGSAVPCCVDYEGEAAFGKLTERGWGEIWASEQRRRALRRFFLGEIGACKRCSLGYGYSRTVFDRRERGA